MPSSVYPTLYDETHKSVNYSNPSIMSVGNCQNLVGQIEHHAPTTDGSFSVCVASGSGIFTKKALLDSIPDEHRPALDTSTAGQSIESLFDNSMTPFGTALLPFILQKTTGEKVRIVVKVFVMPDLLMGMFIGTAYGRQKEDIVMGTEFGHPTSTSVLFDFKTDGPGKTFQVKGLMGI